MTYPPQPDPYDPTRGFPAPPPYDPGQAPPVVSGPPGQPYSPGPYPQPGDQYGTPAPGFLPENTPPPRKRAWPYAALAVALVACGTAAYIAYDRGIILKDSGIKACEAFREGQSTFNGEAQNKDPLTEAKYRELRGVFEDSRYDDIRDHGTKLMDLVWQVSQLGDEPGLEALAYMGPLTTHMTGLQSACADQGIIVNLKPAANPSATTAPEAGEIGIPACSDVFTAGKKIAEDFGGECSTTSGQPFFLAAMDCSDGRKLYQVDAGSGAKPGWGYTGDKYKADDTAKPNSKYFDALEDCTS